MFGLQDFWISLAFILCLLSALGCVVYGIINWNKGADIKPEEIREEEKWGETEQKVEETL